MSDVKRWNISLNQYGEPVGEREAFEEWLLTTGIPLTDTNPYALASWDAWKASAAHQRQQAREVVMPERKELPDLLLATYHENRGWNACLDEFARLNKGAGSHE